MITKWVSHLLDNMRIYAYAHQTDINFIPALLFCIDKAAALFLRSCQTTEQRNKVNDKVLEMESSMQSIEEQNFHQVLPPGLLAIKQAENDLQAWKRLKLEQEQGGGDSGGGGGGKKDGRNEKGGKQQDDKGC